MPLNPRLSSTTPFAALSLTLLLGCAAEKPVPKIAATPAPFSIDTPVHIIAADQRGKAVLDRDLPHLMASRSYILFDDMSLTEIASLSGGKLTQTKLALVQADLAQLSAATP